MISKTLGVTTSVASTPVVTPPGVSTQESDRQAECSTYATGYANQSQPSDDYDSSVVKDRR